MLLANVVHADTLAERREVAIKIVEARNGDTINVEAFRRSCMAKMEEEGKKQNATPEEQEAVKKATSETLASVTRERLVAAMSEGYASRLTLEELKGVLAFYESPAGKALSREQSQINKETSASMNAMVADLVAEITARYDARKKE